MFLIGSFQTWKPWLSGVEFLVSPLDAESRDAIFAEIVDVTDPGERYKRYQVLAAQRHVHDWKGVGVLDKDGKPVPTPCTPESIAKLMSEPRARDFLSDLLIGLGLRKSEDIEKAGND